MKKYFLSAFAAAAFLGALALPAAAQNVAIVNGKPVPQSRVDALTKEVEASGQKITPEIAAQIKTEVIAREVFMQEAQKRGLDATPEYKDQMELARQTVLIRDLFADFQKKNPVTDAEIKATYDKYVAANSGQEYHAHHILVKTEAQADAIIAQLKKGAKFEDLAKKLSIDTGSGANGGDLGWANAGSYVKPFSDAMIALKKGQTTDVPVKTQYGYHIIRLDDVRAAKLPTLDEVKPQIVKQLEQQKLAKFEEDLRAKAKIE